MSIPRKDMPQIDDRVLPALVAYCRRIGIKVERTTLPPWKVKPIQDMKETVDHVYGYNAVVDAKPVLVSSDFYIIDGDHHWVTWKKIGSPNMPVYIFDRPILDILKVLKKFPYTYQVGDGKIHEKDSYIHED